MYFNQFRKLSRTSTDLLICDEYLKFEVNSDSVKTSSLRFLLFAVERSGNQDLMFEDIIRLNTSMIPHHQQTIEFKTWPEVYKNIFSYEIKFPLL